MTGKTSELGFLQEFYALEIRVGTATDNFEELKGSVLRLCEQEGIDLAQHPDVQSRLQAILTKKIKLHFYSISPTGIQGEQLSVKIIDYEEQQAPLRFVVTLLTNLYADFDRYSDLQQAQVAFLQDIRFFFQPLAMQQEVEVSLHRTSPRQPRSMSDGFFKLLSKTNLFWSASGASVLLLEESYTDHNKYKNLGAAILLTGAFAFVSATFALSYLTSNWLIILPVALLWCLTIINIDMMIINTMVKYKKQGLKSFFGFLSRVLLGVAIAISISIPVEMTLLEDEIRDEIERNDRALLQTELDNSLLAFSELDTLKAQKVALQTRFNEEMQGKTGGSGRVGYGTIAKKLEEQITTLDSTILRLEAERDSTESRVRNEIGNAQVENNKYGFLASYRALHRLQYNSEDNSVFYIALGIKILLLLIELLPIISKSLMRRGAYDALYELEEQKYVRTSDRRRL